MKVAQVAWVLAFAIAAAKDTKHLQAFLGELQRRLSEEQQTDQQWREQRQSWCRDHLQLLAEEAARGEGVVEKLRRDLKELKTQDENPAMIQLAQGGNATASRALVSAEARLAEVQEHLKLRGASSSATHRFEAALRQECDKALQHSSEQQQALQDQISMLQSSSQAIDAAEAMHGIEISMSKAQRQVSFLQLAQAPEGEDFLSLFRQERSDQPQQEERVRSREEPALDVTVEERPRVLELLAQLHQEGSSSRSKRESWCAEALAQQRRLARAAAAEAKTAQAEAEALRREESAMLGELHQLQRVQDQSAQAIQYIVSDSASIQKALSAVQRDSAIAAKVLKKAVASLPSGEGRSDPADTAKKYLLAAQQSLQKQAAACAGRLSDAKAEATVKAGEELVSALQLEGRRLQLQADGAQRKERRSGELAALYEGQARAAEAYIKSLKGCGQNLEPQLKADAQALQDAELVFAGESPAPRVLRGAKNLSPVESAALAMGVAVD